MDMPINPQIRIDPKEKGPISLVKRALSAHAALGLAIAAVLYIIVLSGTVSVFKEDIHLIEQRGEPFVTDLTPAAAQSAAIEAMQMEPDSAHLYIHMPTPEQPRAIAQTDNVETYINSKGQMSDRIAHPWSIFLIDLHYYLHLPKSFGMIIVAIFGVFLFAMSITGLLAHPNIFKEAFTFRRSKSEQLKQVDLHNRLSVWTAPFHITNSLTGAMIGLAVLSAAAIAPLKYNGDTGAVFAPVFGAEPEVDMTKAPMANIEKALDYMAANHPDRPPLYVILHDPNTKGQYLQIMAEHKDRLIYAEKYNFDGNGNFIDTVGSADGTLGQQFADSVYRIHFGAFGGLPVKIAFGIFGLCLMFIITAGLKIYFLKRIQKGRAAPRLQGAWQGLVWGAPLLLGMTFLASRFIPVTQSHLAALFWGGLVLFILAGAVKSALEMKDNPQTP
ncbi:putative iron-regulated membrane protein [Litorimonas taeanensis]|uniref:Putative iron-regulated membrane protein n=2 Tax=Litorimonas taeanensis TaxID=568099 RepID=A0A420WLE8_9PROT|nr:putative iron-regulated membrane protein [Litorimonas taeanensis]